MYKKVSVFVIAVLLMGFGVISRVEAMSNVTENAVVIGIVDGDTLRVIYNKKREYVRLIGVDTPESRRNDKLMRDVYRTKQDVNTILSLGAAAKEYLSGIVKPKDVIILEFDVQKRDRYRRLLAYVYLPDGRMINDELVKSGYAMPLTVQPNVKYQDRFLESFKSARGL